MPRPQWLAALETAQALDKILVGQHIPHVSVKQRLPSVVPQLAHGGDGESEAAASGEETLADGAVIAGGGESQSCTLACRVFADVIQQPLQRRPPLAIGHALAAGGIDG